MPKSAGTQWVWVLRDGARDPVEKGSGEEQTSVSEMIEGDKNVEILEPEHIIDKRFRATEGLWYPAAKMERYENDFDQHSFEEGKWKDTVMNLIGIALSRKQQYQDQQQKQEHDQQPLRISLPWGARLTRMYWQQQEQEPEQKQQQQQVFGGNYQTIRIL